MVFGRETGSAMVMRKSCACLYSGEKVFRKMLPTLSLPSSGNIDFTYSDTDVHLKELAELYSYNEEQDFTANRTSFEELMENYGCPLKRTQALPGQRARVVERLAEGLELTKRGTRVRAIRALLYLAQGNFAYCQTSGSITCLAPNDANSSLKLLVIIVYPFVLERGRPVEEEEEEEAQHKQQLRDRFKEELMQAIAGELLHLTLLELVIKLCQNTGVGAPFPMKKILLLLLKTLLLALDGSEHLSTEDIARYPLTVGELDEKAMGSFAETLYRRCQQCVKTKTDGPGGLTGVAMASAAAANVITEVGGSVQPPPSSEVAATVLHSLQLKIDLNQHQETIMTTVDVRAKECFFERLATSDKLAIVYDVIGGGFRDLVLSLSAPEGGDLVSADDNDPSSSSSNSSSSSSSGRYTFAAAEEGEYRWCFDNGNGQNCRGRSLFAKPKVVKFAVEVFVSPSFSAPSKNASKAVDQDSDHADRLKFAKYESEVAATALFGHHQLSEQLHSNKTTDTVDREKKCPLLLRVFIHNHGRHHNLNEFARGNVPSKEVQIYTWMDATLMEQTALVKEVNQECRKPGSRFDFALVFPDSRANTYRMREIGSTVSGRKDLADIIQSLQFHYTTTTNSLTAKFNRSMSSTSQSA
ncbi:Histone deacetylase complex subunit sap18 [Tyrophagus putrescentiae]|nr:Histone deacetylase complex subunit sap18 [Tyrophagus putrescentiae]